MAFRSSFRFFLLASTLVGCSPRVISEAVLDEPYYPVDSLVQPNAEALTTISPYKNQLGEEMKTAIGTAAHAITNDPGRGESALGNLAADLILTKSRERYDEVDLSVINAHGGLRVPINKGPILVENIYEVMPFDNTIYIYSLSGPLTLKLFDHCAGTLRNVIGGASFKIEGSKAIDIVIGNEPFDNSKSYVLAISDYLASGGNGFGFVGDQGEFLKDINYLQRDMIIDFIKDLTKEGVEISSEIDGRMKRLDE
ncbi:MAG: 5'-nucleotidase C-terminal domain-containing protein [Cyclobacteriaceae bacterium]